MSRIERAAKSGLAVIAVAFGAWLFTINAFPPWQPIRLVPASDTALVIGVIVATAAAATCAWRLSTGESGRGEIARFLDATRDAGDV